MLLSWARHGENVANLTETFSYRVFDRDLTDLGREQAQALARRLAGDPDGFGYLASSPLRRAVQTAEIVAGYLDLPIAATLNKFREVNVGELDGRNDAAAWATYTATLRAWRDGDRGRRFPGGEDGHELAARLRDGLTYVAEHSSSQPALVIAHGANLRAALPDLAGVTDPGADLPTGNVAQLEVTLGPGGCSGVRLVSWGSQSP